MGNMHTLVSYTFQSSKVMEMQWCISGILFCDTFCCTPVC